MSQTILVSYLPSEQLLAAQLFSALTNSNYQCIDLTDSQTNKQLNNQLSTARCFLVILSREALQSKDIQRQVALAQNISTRPSCDLKVIAIVCSDVTTQMLDNFCESTQAINVSWLTKAVQWLVKSKSNEVSVDILPIRLENSEVGLSFAITQVFTEIGGATNKIQFNTEDKPASPYVELVLKLSQPNTQSIDGVNRLVAKAQLSYKKSHDDSGLITSLPFDFIAPFGTDEQDEINWYIESYHRWPTGVFKNRAAKVEHLLTSWGSALYRAVFMDNMANNLRDPVTNWLKSKGIRQFSIQVLADEKNNHTQQAAAGLLAIPWEIMHDGNAYILHSSKPVQIRRCLADHVKSNNKAISLPIRVLLICPRPEIAYNGAAISYLDHRTSAIALLKAAENLGKGLIELDILHTPTLQGLSDSLKQAHQQHMPYSIVHFDGHGVFDENEGMGALCFEDPQDSKSLHTRKVQLIYADDLAKTMAQYNVPLVFLDACKTAQSSVDPKSSVAARLLAGGVSSVVAMSHSVLVQTTECFIEPFYRALAQGLQVGEAVSAGQKALFTHQFRFKVQWAGDLTLQDWFVPVLYQQYKNMKPLTKHAEVSITQPIEHLSIPDNLPTAPRHSFVGRSRELLQLERMLQQMPFVVVKGNAGVGKTAITVELARWLRSIGHYQQAIFIDLAPHQLQDLNGVINQIGKQLNGEFDLSKYKYELNSATDDILKALHQRQTIIIFDGIELILPDHCGNPPQSAVPATDLFNWCKRICDHSINTRLIFTSRETLPEPLNKHENILKLDSLNQQEAINLVEKVIAQHGWTPPKNDNATTPEQIATLVETVDCQPRALVLLAPQLANGIQTAITNITELMVQLESQNPDDNENSVYASIELSLRRLTPEVRALVNQLAAFHGGGLTSAIKIITKMEDSDIEKLAKSLVAVGLGDFINEKYIRFDSALPSYLKKQLTDEEFTELQIQWARAMCVQLIALEQTKSQSGPAAAEIFTLDLRNFLALLDWFEIQIDNDESKAEMVTQITGLMQTSFSALGLTKAVARTNALREQAGSIVANFVNQPPKTRLDQAAESLADTQAKILEQFPDLAAEFDQVNEIINSHKYNPNIEQTHFVNQYGHIKALRNQGELTQALEQAIVLLEQIKQENYATVIEDLALLQDMISRILIDLGQFELALEHATEAKSLFVQLGEAQLDNVQIAWYRQGSCHLGMNNLEQARDCYHQSLAIAEKLQDEKQIASNKAMLATIAADMGQFDYAISELISVVNTAEQLNDLSMLEGAYTNLGAAYLRTEQFEAAENAFIQSQRICKSIGDRAGEAGSCGNLGQLYLELSRIDESLAFVSQALDIYLELNNPYQQAMMRRNKAIALCYKQQFDMARSEAQQAIALVESFEQPHEMMMYFGLLNKIEDSRGDSQAALAAWQQARSYYLQYRLEGGQTQCTFGQMLDHLLAQIKQGDIVQVINDLSIMSQGPMPDNSRAFVTSLLAIVQGSGDTALADNLIFGFDEAAELLYAIKCLHN